MIGRKALSRNIGDHHIDAAVGAVKYVIEVAGHDSRRHAPGGDLPAGSTEFGWRQQAALDIASHLQLATAELPSHQFIELETFHKIASVLGADGGYDDLV